MLNEIVQRTLMVAMLTLASVTAAVAQGPAEERRGAGRAGTAPGNADAADAVSDAELATMLDSYAMFQAQQQLAIADEQFGVFAARVKKLQDTRRRNQRQRARIVQELRRLAMPPAKPVDEAAVAGAAHGAARARRRAPRRAQGGLRRARRDPRSAPAGALPHPRRTDRASQARSDLPGARAGAGEQGQPAAEVAGGTRSSLGGHSSRRSAYNESMGNRLRTLVVLALGVGVAAQLTRAVPVHEAGRRPPPDKAQPHQRVRAPLPKTATARSLPARPRPRPRRADHADHRRRGQLVPPLQHQGPGPGRHRRADADRHGRRPRPRAAP